MPNLVLHILVINSNTMLKVNFDIAVESKLKSKKEIFGREMAENFRTNQPMPTLVELCDRDNHITVDLKKLIANMTKLESNNRTRIHDVDVTMKSVLGNHYFLLFIILILLIYANTKVQHVKKLYLL